MLSTGDNKDTRPAPWGSEDGGKKKKRKKQAAVAVELQTRGGKCIPTLTEVQNLLLRIFTAEHGENPKWLCIRGMGLVNHAVVLLVPCLDAATLRTCGDKAPATARLLQSPWASTMRSSGEVEHFPRHVGLNRAACRMVHMLLSARVKPAVKNKTAAAAAAAVAAAATKPPIRTYLASAEALARSGYPTRLYLDDREGWISTGSSLQCTTVEVEFKRDGTDGGSMDSKVDDPDRALLLGMDCEMVQTASGSALARVSIVGPEGEVLYDQLVRPTEPITDYLTQWSGITEEMLTGSNIASLEAVQAKVLQLVSANNILVGHSLENDLEALRLVHERIIDTALLFPHPRGWPYRNGLASLSANILKRKLDRTAGHDSVQDACTALELALLKFSHGPGFGSPGGESAPLGKVLNASGTLLSLSDEASHHSTTDPAANQNAHWHLQGCQVGDPQDSQCETIAEDQSKQRKHVKVIVFREYEELCATRAAGNQDSDPTACLADLDKIVVRIASRLGEDELLMIISGCGDLHSFQKISADATGISEDERRKTAMALKDAFGVWVVGGDELRSTLSEAGYIPGDGGKLGGQDGVLTRRELVMYDD